MLSKAVECPHQVNPALAHHKHLCAPFAQVALLRHRRMICAGLVRWVVKSITCAGPAVRNRLSSRRSAFETMPTLMGFSSSPRAARGAQVSGFHGESGIVTQESSAADQHRVAFAIIAAQAARKRSTRARS